MDVMGWDRMGQERRGIGVDASQEREGGRISYK